MSSSVLTPACLAAAALLGSGCSEVVAEQPALAPEVVSIGDANNYKAQASLAIPTLKTAAATDLDICWSDLTSDVLCHEMAPPEDIDNVALLRILELEEAEVEAKLAADALQQSAIDGYVEYPTSSGDTCAKLSEFTLFDTVVDPRKEYVESDARSYLVVFTTGTIPGAGARSMLFLEPSAASTNTRVDAPPGCGILDFSADIATAEPVVVPAHGPWIFDWSDLVQNGLGNELLLSSIDRALVGFYAGRSVADLEAGIFDLESSATSLYETLLDGRRKTDLSVSREVTTGEAFSGFEREEPGVWLFGLLCSTCKNPAPQLLAVLSPREEGL